MVIQLVRGMVFGADLAGCGIAGIAAWGGARGPTRQKGQFFSFARKSVSQLAIGGFDPAMRRPAPPRKAGSH